jgi:galactokinase
MSTHRKYLESLFAGAFPGSEPDGYVAAPGRVNLIGEHIDYHGLLVLPVAIERKVRISFRRRSDSRICVRNESPRFEPREFEWTPELTPLAPGDWGNYLMAAAKAIGGRCGVLKGIDAFVSGDLPLACGLSSSSALIVAFTLALLRANQVHASFEVLMEILPEGEQFVGTRGGGMDHAISLGGRKGCAVEISWDPLQLRYIPIPEGWSFLAAPSLKAAEKSAAVRDKFNNRRFAGERALASLGFTSFRELIGRHTTKEIARMNFADQTERRCMTHVVNEAARVRTAAAALESGNATAFATAMNESHDSLRDLLQVSCPELDRLVECSRRAGALGARLTGAGFGGYAILFAMTNDIPYVRQRLLDSFYTMKKGFDPDVDLIDVQAANGALEG